MYGFSRGVCSKRLQMNSGLWWSLWSGHGLTCLLVFQEPFTDEELLSMCSLWLWAFFESWSWISFNENDFRPINAFTFFEAPQNNNISQFQTHQHACQHVARICRSFSWPTPILEWGTSLFICMPRHEQKCCICNNRISSSGDGRPISSIQDDNIKHIVSKKYDKQTHRVHSKCATTPLKYIKNKVRPNTQHTTIGSASCTMC